MRDKQTLAAVVLIVIAAVLYMTTRQVKPGPPSLFQVATGNTYDPYCHWASAGDHYFHKFPTTIGENTLGQAIQEEDQGLAMIGLDIDGRSYPQ